MTTHDDEEMPTMRCPRCGQLEPDMDGFGMLAHAPCGYCTHPSITDGVCGICEVEIGTQRAARARGTEHAVILMQLSHAMQAVRAERLRQMVLWGHVVHPDGCGREDLHAANMHIPSLQMMRRLWERESRRGGITFAWILLGEVVEALTEEDPARLREELVQVAAVAVRWIEALDQRPPEGKDEHGT